MFFDTAMFGQVFQTFLFGRQSFSKNLGRATNFFGRPTLVFGRQQNIFWKSKVVFGRLDKFFDVQQFVFGRPENMFGRPNIFLSRILNFLVCICIIFLVFKSTTAPTRFIFVCEAKGYNLHLSRFRVSLMNENTLFNQEGNVKTCDYWRIPARRKFQKYLKLVLNWLLQHLSNSSLTRLFKLQSKQLSNLMQDRYQVSKSQLAKFTRCPKRLMVTPASG